MTIQLRTKKQYGRKDYYPVNAEAHKILDILKSIEPQRRNIPEAILTVIRQQGGVIEIVI